MENRIAAIKRVTKETDIALSLNLDGSGTGDISTGIGFFDHMLDGFARHGLFDLTCHVKGDLEVDCHHTIEDTGIVLGQAIREAVGDKKGMVRFGSCILPMDETLVLCSLDLSGSVRSALLYFSMPVFHSTEERGGVLLFVYEWLFAYVSLHALCACNDNSGQKRELGPLKVKPRCCKLPCGCWELNTEPLEEWPVPLTAEPCLYPQGRAFSDLLITPT